MKTVENNKIYTNILSQGCQTCLKGKWVCLYLGHECLRDCFFCLKPHDRNVSMYARFSGNKMPVPESFINHKFNSTDPMDQFVELVSASDLEGVSFSGGEPFLYFTKMLYCIKKLRELSKPLYIWAYTCGDFVTEDSIQYLKEAGLNELRFNIIAKKDLSKLTMASKYLDVAVEIPSIPGHEFTRDTLNELINCGVKYINLHELHVNEYNRQKILDKNFIIKNDTVVGSEDKALAVLEAADNLPISVNYCSYKYKTNSRGN